MTGRHAAPYDEVARMFDRTILPPHGQHRDPYSSDRCPEHGDLCRGASCCCVDLHPAAPSGPPPASPSAAGRSPIPVGRENPGETVTVGERFPRVVAHPVGRCGSIQCAECWPLREAPERYTLHG